VFRDHFSQFQEEMKVWYVLIKDVNVKDATRAKVAYEGYSNHPLYRQTMF
jgi:hypothetical protein